MCGVSKSPDLKENEQNSFEVFFVLSKFRLGEEIEMA